MVCTAIRTLDKDQKMISTVCLPNHARATVFHSICFVELLQKKKDMFSLLKRLSKNHETDNQLCISYVRFHVPSESRVEELLKMV